MHGVKKKFVFKNIRAGREQKKFTLFFVWLLSYVFVLLIPIISFLGGIFTYERNYSKHIEQFHTSMTTATASGIKEILVDINELQSMLLLHNPNISEVLSINQPDRYYGSKEVINFVSDLATYKTYKSNIDFIFIYIEDTDIIIHETGAYDSRYFYDIYFKGASTYEDWKKQLCQGSSNNAKYYSTSVRINDNLKNAVCFRSPLSPSSFITKPLRSNLFILVDEERFFRSIDVGIDYCDTYIFDSRGNTVLYNLKTNNPVIPKTLRELTDKGQETSLKMQNLSFQTTEMTVALLIPPEQLKYGLISSRMIVIVLVAICLALAALLITYFMKKNYSPLDSIMSGLNIPKSDSRTEIGSLGEHIKQLFTSNAALSNTLANQSSLLQDFTLTQLLSGNYNSTANLMTGDKYVSEFIYKNFVVIIFSWDNLDNMFDDPTISSEEKLNEMYFIIKNIFEELFTEENSIAKVVAYGNSPVCIINTDKSKEDIENKLSDQSSYGCEIIRENFFVNVSFTCSSQYSSLQDLSTAFSEAKRALNYKKFYDASLLLSAKQGDNLQNSYDYPLDLEEKLINSICSGDISAAQNIVNVIFEKLIADGRSSDYTNCIISAIISTLMRVSTNSGVQINLSLLVEASDDIESQKKKILSCIETLCQSESKEELPSAALPEKTLKYVLENYTSSTLGVNTIAAHFGVSSFYLSKVFKESYKHTLVDFIHEYRLEKATELIRSNQYSFIEISEMLGYNHIRTFNRVFKKYIGVTPSEYKKNL